MKITRLELIDYKCFEHLILEDLGDRIILVGPNGCGKSTILEAIAVVKEYIGTYDPNQQVYSQYIPLLNRQALSWRADIPLPIRSEQSSATVKLTLALNEAEAHVIGGVTEVEVSIQINPTREVIPTLSHTGVSDLFRRYDPESAIGIFDYIAPDRRYSMQRVTNLDMNRLSVDQQRRERIELLEPGVLSQKFGAVKHYIIAEQLKDLSLLNSTRQSTNSIALLQELFSFFFGPKTLIGSMSKDGELQVVVRTPYGDHDIDQLSSGEKELFTVFTSLFRIRNFPAVILYDEPERHLNPGL